MNDPFKELIIDALCGAGFNSIYEAMRYERRGYATQTGSQHADNWTWNRAALAQLSTEGLQEIYQGIKESQNLRAAANDVIVKASAAIAKAASHEPATGA